MGSSLRQQADGASEARLHLDGLATPIVTRVTRQGATGMTVEQTLPFLRLQTAVRDDANQQAHIESVSMVVYEGMPHLVLDLAYDDVAQDSAAEADAAAIEPRRASAGVVRPRAREATTPFEVPAPELEERDDPPAVREPTLAFTTATARADEPAHGLAGEQLTLEEQLLLERSLKHRLKAHWTRIEPTVRRIASVLHAGAVLAWARLRPLLRAVARHGLAVLRAGLVKVRARRARLPAQ